MKNQGNKKSVGRIFNDKYRNVTKQLVSAFWLTCMFLFSHTVSAQTHILSGTIDLPNGVPIANDVVIQVSARELDSSGNDASPGEFRNFTILAGETSTPYTIQISPPVNTGNEFQVDFHCNSGSLACREVDGGVGSFFTLQGDGSFSTSSLNSIPFNALPTQQDLSLIHI